MWKFLCVKASLCKGVCVKAPACKSSCVYKLHGVKNLSVKKGLLCESFSVQELRCVKALFLCV